jgi:hypothetical protein
VACVGWLAIEREAGRRSVSAASLPQYISAVLVVAKSFFDGQEALTAGRIPILKALLRAYWQWEARSFPRLTHRSGLPADIIQAFLGKRHAVGRARGDTGFSGGNPFLRAGKTRIARHVTTRGEHYAHSSKDDRSAGVSEGQGITARGAGNVRTDRPCYLTITHRPVAEVDWSAACARFAHRLARRWK